MAIDANTDIKLLESERMTDTADGGGRMTGSVVDDGEVNNIFQDISRLDSTYGRLNLRKVYMAVRSLGTETYLGGHVIVTRPPAATNVSVTLFTTGSVTDVRTGAQNRIESYVTSGPLSAYYLYGNQPQGSKAISLFGRVESSLPEVGEVILLSVEDGAGVVSAEQYVRIQDVNSEVRTFTDGSGEYQRKIVTLILTTALRQTFAGAEASRLSNVGVATKVRATTVADAAQYFGVTKLNGDVFENDLEITVDSIFSQLVPSTRREVPISAARPGLTLNYVAIAAPLSETFAGGNPVYLQRGLFPRSITAVAASTTITGDDGLGNLIQGSTDRGDVDYDSGRLSGATITSVTYTPATTVSQSACTVGVKIQLANQGTVYVQTMPVLPAPKTLRVEYRFLGKWYALADRKGDGTLEGATAAEGGGTVDYITGNVVVTLGGLPDIGSFLIYSCGQNTDYVQRSGTVTPTTPAVEFSVANAPVEPGTMTFAWYSGAVLKNATANSGGVISGDATGTVVHQDGFVTFVPNSNAWPDGNSALSIGYTKGTGAAGTVTASATGPLVTGTIAAGGLPIAPGNLVLRVPATWADRTVNLYAKDDGSGNLITAPDRKGGYGSAPVVAGSIDYTTGAFSIQFGTFTANVYTQVGFANVGQTPKYTWESVTAVPTIIATPLVQFWARKAAAGSVVASEEVDFPGISIYLTRGLIDSTVPGSVWFSWGGKEYFDRNGKILRDLVRGTGVATEAGTIDYSTGEVRLTNYGASSGGSVTIKTLLTSNGTLPTSYLLFRTPGSPVRPASVYVQALRADTGALISATSDTGGTISGAGIEGEADHDMGWVKVRFGVYVTAAGNESEPWYDAANVVGPNVFKPIPVNPNSITFNCVVLTNLPLDAALLGIDPVRLPQTGKVPIIREGNVIVISEARAYTMPGSLTAGQVVTIPDAPIAQLEIVDADGDVVPLSKYTAELLTAGITMATPLDLSLFTQPLVARYVVENMRLVSSVDLSGKVSLVAPLDRDFSDDAVVSSALLFGDLQAQNPIFFDQQTWTGAWDNDRIGSGTTSEYNRTLYPLELVNKNTISERWALIFTSSTGGTIVGETTGAIGSFSTSLDCAPVNPVTGEPYFTLKKEGWGTGWATNNVLRFNTIGPNAPIWVARTVIPGASALEDDYFRLQMRGDAD
ncbi:hypothetical protein [Arenimonas oryziterrae]|uniref:Uncharacterized protein n=1 Tax=Arenimonas oryziterrae DSM 21050 = YC6267 TaxID=1121015 RepID=A0A091BD62_9GAMM|nr:hypothetical protein [Arenimonas oryziterrae]KFN42345.1 hypothetical protein N789_14240 [Arenimonas oryziterrae DSM 21050 = YC6267]